MGLLFSFPRSTRERILGTLCVPGRNFFKNEQRTTLDAERRRRCVPTRERGNEIRERTLSLHLHQLARMPKRNQHSLHNRSKAFGKFFKSISPSPCGGLRPKRCLEKHFFRQVRLDNPFSRFILASSPLITICGVFLATNPYRLWWYPVFFPTIYIFLCI